MNVFWPKNCLLPSGAGRYSYAERQERSETSRTDFGNYYKDWKQRQPTTRAVDSGATVNCSGSVYDDRTATPGVAQATR